ncbi:glycosyltransferase family 2 protein [Alkalicoccus luteus]|uniref:Glycosyltransferase family 2 protein n=1 Tax=Alkalicoccus luteus TaxID=1237094 RepID=A0A969PQW7_9BACI|nr:glycosyltransferase family A protein [Alkalicoccus luteus]NJP38765.1 glycosyltransferase family 2 protein [Alkalicoccus luteus]
MDLTIFTPTYNRAHTLPRVYDSLLRQTDKRFIWMIIDDGSTDSTAALVNNWIKQADITIIYRYQENQGMHGAHNTAYNMISTRWNTCLDSDDLFLPEAVEHIYRAAADCPESCTGIAFHNCDMNSDRIGTAFPDTETSTLYDLYRRHQVRGDKKLVYKSEWTRKWPYPLFDSERYVGLDYKYLNIDAKGPLYLCSEVICQVDYQDDGSSKNMLRQYKRNPAGFSFYRKEMMKLPHAGIGFQYRNAIHYVSSSWLIRNRRFLNETPKKWLTAAAIPPGTMLAGYIWWRNK